MRTGPAALSAGGMRGPLHVSHAFEVWPWNRAALPALDRAMKPVRKLGFR